jgi:peptidoglycan hydrolase-like protein with peptidoglycan-binding domain
VDPKVLQAQQWVNATYRGVPGFNPAPENGVTGWPTMYALTRALQRELGITTLSDNFGPTTLGLLAARGDIGYNESNANLVKIIQSALYCKGYEAGGIDGGMGSTTINAIYELKNNCGLPGGGMNPLTPKVFKALLTMDAYIVVAGGTEQIRRIQQWLNGKYTRRRDFYVIPCDGIFSRDVQKALYLAIQFELGLTDDEATGIFGPRTQAGLRAHPLTEGMQGDGVWIQIFSAAIVFNRVALESGGVYDVFTNIYQSSLTAAVRQFQKFSQLAVNGNADYATWCQALVSTGDADRPGAACDGITTITDARAQALRAAGYQVVGRYLDERPSPKPLNKRLQPGELDTIFRNGLKVFPISQYWGGEVSYFTYSQGYQDALEAHVAAAGYGFNTGTVIYFAVDYDATQAEIDARIIPYFNGVVAGLAAQGKKYVHGVYGSRNVCAEVTNRTYARWSFVSGMSYGFSGNMGFPLPDNWAYNQIQTLFVGSGTGRIEIDKNVYRLGTDPAVSSVNDPGSPVDAFVAYIRQVYNLAVVHGGRNPNQLVMEWLRSQDYANFQWRQLIGDIDGSFITRVNDAGVRRITELRDPFYGIDLKVSHLGASCNGHFLVDKPSGNTANRGDVAGWGGDLMTFYGEWRRDSDSYASGLTYCNEKLGKIEGNGTFKLRDLIEDADAWNIAKRIKAGSNIADVVASYYATGGNHLTRFKRYYEDRWGSATAAKAVARDMLTASRDQIINAGRAYLIQTTGGVPTVMPHILPDDLLDGFLQGFSNMLLNRVGLENARLAKLRAQGKI